VTVWHERDVFWEAMAPKIFSALHWELAPLEIEKVTALLELKHGNRVLDLCCGTGRHSLELARLGFRVTGVDRTSRYLDEARRKAKERSLNIDFRQIDMRDYCRPETFDAVINLYTSFGYFEDLRDDKRVLNNIYTSLKKGGRLLIDLMGKEVLDRIFRERDWYEDSGVFFLEERKLSDDGGWIHNRWIKIDGDKRDEFHLSLRLYSGEELSSLLYESGFREVKLYGDLSGKPYDDTANRLIALAIR